jgi:hypothetical protein
VAGDVGDVHPEQLAHGGQRTIDGGRVGDGLQATQERPRRLLGGRAGRGDDRPGAAVERDAVAPAGLGGVHGRVRRVQRVLRGAQLRAERRHARAQGHAVLAGVAPLGHERHELGRHGVGGPHVRVAQQHGELVAAEAPDRVLVARAGGERRGDERQDAVAGPVAAAVVDRLEVVDVDEDQRGEAPVAADLGEHELELLLHAAAVEHPGEVVALGQPLEPRGAAAVGRGVLDLGDEEALAVGSLTTPTCRRSQMSRPSPWRSAGDLVGAAVLGERPQAIARAVALLRAHEREGVAADHRRGVVAEELAERPVRPHDDQLGVGEREGAGRLVEDGPAVRGGRGPHCDPASSRGASSCSPGGAVGAP